VPVIFCNIGWMERYQGLRHGDQIKGGGAYVWKEGRGHEVCNFSPVGRYLYGYVQPRGDQINIERLGSKHSGDAVSGVTVVWTATRPTGGTAIVGWYRNATVYRNYQKFGKIPRVHAANRVDGFRIVAPRSEAVLLPVDARTFEIPRQIKGGMGQSNVWYADAPESASLLRRVRLLVDGRPLSSKGKSLRTKVQDQERKVRIEKSAIRVCCDHYEALGYEVISVEKDNMGWDLIANAGKSSLRIEVKGLSGSAFSIELTPNEYKAFEQQADDYRLAVVTNALDQPSLSICRFSKEAGTWVVDGQPGRSLSVLIKTSASVSGS
jgi:hypothetical protein